MILKCIVSAICWQDPVLGTFVVLLGSETVSYTSVVHFLHVPVTKQLPYIQSCNYPKSKANASFSDCIFIPNLWINFLNMINLIYFAVYFKNRETRASLKLLVYCFTWLNIYYWHHFIWMYYKLQAIKKEDIVEKAL